MREEMIYTNVNFARSKGQKDKIHTTHKSKEFPWHIIAVSLGLLSLILLLASAGLGYMYLQCSSGCKIQHKKYNNGKNNSVAVKNDSVLPFPTEKGYGTCYGKWSCCGRNCYYFSKEVKTWAESKKSCEVRDSSLIKIDDEVEQKFIQSKIQYNYWIGLYAKGTTWSWQDDSKLSEKLNFQLTTFDAKCGQLKLTNIAAAVCTIEFRYICEKKFASLDN